MTAPSRRSGSADETTWTRSADVLFRRVPDGVVVLRLPTGEPELVTGPGGMLWDLLAAPRTASELTDQLATRYRHDAAIVRRDLDIALDALHARHLIAPSP